MRFIRCAQIRLAYNLDERCAGAVEIHIAVTLGIFEAVMDALAGVVFHVYARDADALLAVFGGNVQMAVFGQRLIVLRNLIALRKVRVEVVLTREARKRIDFAMQRKAGPDGQFNGLAAENGKRSGQPETDGAHSSVRRRAEFDRTTAKY